MPATAPTIFDYTCAPCPSCMALFVRDRLHREAIMPLLPGARAPRSRITGASICHDCAASENLPVGDVSFEARRTAVANCRRDQLRCPRIRIGLVQSGLVKPCTGSNALATHLAWLDTCVPEVAEA